MWRFSKAQDRENEKDILWLFDVALILKIINGSLELIASLLILFVPPALVLKLVEFSTSGELTRDPDDPIVLLIRNSAQAFAVHTHYFLAAYLALHGAIKIVLVMGIFAKKKVAYQLFMVSLICFGGYEAYRGFLLGDLLLKALAVFDLSLLVFTLHEYRLRYQARLF